MNLFAELKRRNVFRVGITYLVAAVAFVVVERYLPEREGGTALESESVAAAPVKVKSLPAPGAPVAPIYYRAMVRGLGGDADGAIEDLKLALNMPTALSFTAWDLHYDPNWDFMRDDRRFVKLAIPDSLIR